MVIIIDPTSRNHSHEAFNAGFVALYKKAYPNEEIILSAHRSHLISVQNIYFQSGANTEKIKWNSTNWPKNWSWFGALKGAFYIFKYKKIRKEHEKVKIIFLSSHIVVLHLVKYFFRSLDFGLPVLITMHGTFESCGIKKGESRSINPRNISKSPSFFQFISQGLTKLKSNPKKSLQKIIPSFQYKILNPFLALVHQSFYSFYPDLCTSLKLNSDHQMIRYLVLSDHIMINAIKNPKINFLPISAIPLPILMKPWKPVKISTKPVFSIFGYGLPDTLEKILERLEGLQIKEPYEIKLIGLMPRKMLQYRNVTMSNTIAALSRPEMEKMNKDVHIQLILYPSDSYKLSASGSIFEALAYNKPILHHKNDCISFYNNENLPIGFEEDNLENFIFRMIDLICNFKNYEKELNKFHSNLEILRSRYSIDASASRLRRIYQQSQENLF